MGYNNGITLKSFSLVYKLVKSDFLAIQRQFMRPFERPVVLTPTTGPKKNGLPILSSLHLTHDS